ncbi:MULTISPECIES: SDR family oxidoreductase [Kocuria]|uniref:NAD-dependent dehydratase n=1 Tax=Kocuria rosea subsp. polaris TaxID=136273 RepID=A0A0W8IJA7_KOCRO|nr:SDR family oxidoreductase [Kocuria polaris]KUG60129.1 NAD-dependent dehydratase [Kocuria polaris]
MSRTAIIGGHGKVALILAQLLKTGGNDVTSIFRNPDHTDDVENTGATPVVADVEQLSVAQLADLLEGQDAVVWSAGAGGGSPERTYAVDRDAAIRAMDAAVMAGAKRFVMVSYFGAGQDHGVPEDNPFHAYAQAKADADDHLRASSLDWTIVGPGALTDDEASGKIDASGGEREGEHETSRANVALVVSAVLDDPSTIGKTIEFSDGGTLISEALEVQP